MVFLFSKIKLFIHFLKAFFRESTTKYLRFDANCLQWQVRPQINYFKGDFINKKDNVLVEKIMIKGWGLLAGVVLN